MGRQARVLAPRADLGDWDERARGHDPIGTLLAQNDIRLAELAALRHQRMSLSPWNFYRGAAAVMAADLASRPHSRIEVQLCGDAHVLNFGLWATPERNLNFDLRDFDETLPGPFEWDVARLAASLVVAARENGVKQAKSDAAVTAAVDAYRNRMRYYSTLPAARHLVRGHALRPVHRLLRAGRPRAGEGAVREEQGFPHEPRRLREADDRAARAGAHHPAAPAARDARRRRAGRHRGGAAGGIPPNAARGPSSPVRPLHAGRRRPTGGGRRQRRHGGVPRAARGQRHRATRSSCSASRPVPPSTSPTRTPAATTITGPGSSPASGWCRAPPTSSSGGPPWAAATSMCASSAT